MYKPSHELTEYERMNQFDLVRTLGRMQRKVPVMRDIYQQCIESGKFTEDSTRGERGRQAISDVEAKIDALQTEYRRRKIRDRVSGIAW